MKFIIDSNRVIAALLKDSTTREILYNRCFEFIAPEFVKEEISKYRTELIKKAKIKSEEFDILLSLFFERITLIPKKEYEAFLKKLKSKISDSKDIPYLACCMAIKALGIWSHDPHLKDQDRVKVFTNIDMLRLTH